MFKASSFLLTKWLRRTTGVIVYSADARPATATMCPFLLRRISQLSGQFTVDSSPAKVRKYPILTNERKQGSNRDYTVSYLVESCGLSPKEALSASKKITPPFATPETPDSVLNLLRSHGLNSTQVTTIVRTYPPVLSTNSENMVKPKLEFFQSMGFSEHDIARILCFSPLVLTMSLEKQIEPICSFIKSLVQSDERVCTAIKNSSWLLLKDVEQFLVPNVSKLRELGVPGPNISLLLTHFPNTLVQSPDKVIAAVCKAKEMGFDPSKANFVKAVQAFSGKSKKWIWDRSYRVFSTKWGWSEEDILSAFKKDPHCMIMSEKKLNSVMDFLVNTMGWSSKRIAHRPAVLHYSLEKRIIPRCSVIRVLWTKGLLSKDLTPGTVLDPGEKDFLKRYVTKYEEQVPQLLSVYKGDMDALDLQ